MWMRYILWAAATESLVRGAAEPSHSLGILVAAYGVAYAIAALDPRRHWPIVLAGLLAKIFEPVVLRRIGWVLFLRDVIWWVPFTLILMDAYRANAEQGRTVSPEVELMAMRARTQQGSTLLELSKQAPVLLVFLRHTGCTFCREALADLAADEDTFIDVKNSQVFLTRENFIFDFTGQAKFGPEALKVFDTNVIGLIRVTQAALPLLAKSDNPVVVNVSSALGSFSI